MPDNQMWVSDILDRLSWVRTFDVVSPAMKLVNDLLHEGETFYLPLGDYTGADIIRCLNSYGIETWGQMIVDDSISFTVLKSQADRATQILVRLGLIIPGERTA